MSLATVIKLGVSADLVSALDLANSRNSLAFEKLLALATGVGAGQADLIFHDQRTIGASGTEDLDLAGVLLDPFGAALTFARIKAIIIYAATGNTNNVEVTRPAANSAPIFLAASDGVSIRPGGLFVLAALDATGYPVTAGTADLITVTNSAGTTGVTYDAVIIGASA